MSEANTTRAAIRHQVNYAVCVEQIRQTLGLPPQACCADIVAKVREVQFAAATAGAVLQDQQAKLVMEHGTATPNREIA